MKTALEALKDTPAAMSAAALFRAHAPFVAGFLARLGVHPQDVEDLVQEVFLTAHRRGGYVPGPAHPTTWLAEIALRVASTARRTGRRRGADLDEEQIAAAVALDEDPFEAAARTEALRRVDRALEKLDLDRRAVFVLFELEGQDCESIAAGLGIPLGTVYSRLHFARREFRRAYERAAAVQVRPPRQPNQGGQT